MIVEPVKKVLQYRYVPFHSKHHAFNCEYFFNDGKLSSNHMLTTLNHVIVALELNDFHVHLLVMDAGGSNKGLFSLLIGKKLPRYGWLDGNFVVFENPYDHMRKIVIVFCATHGLKAIRNGMYNSKGGKFSTRMLLNCEDVPLNWKQIESWLVNDNNIIVDTDLSPFSANF